MDLSAVAWGDLLSQGMATKASTGICVAASQLDRNQRLVLFASSTGKLPGLVQRYSGRFSLFGKGRTLHHSFQTPQRCGDSFGEFLRFRCASLARETGSNSLATAAALRLRSSQAGGVLSVAPTHDVRRRCTCAQTR